MQQRMGMVEWNSDGEQMLLPGPASERPGVTQHRMAARGGNNKEVPLT